MLRTTSLVGLLALVLIAVARAGLYLPSVFALGLLLGMVLYLSSFGFTSTYRKLILYGDTGGIRAQLVMLMLTTLLFAPILSAGQIFGREAVGAIGPAGWSVVIGACMFGIGMQLGGGCGSGALYTFGGGNLRMAITLATFIIGSFWASLHMHWWVALPSLGPWSFGGRVGWGQAAIMQMVILAALFWIMTLRKPSDSEPILRSAPSLKRWSLMQGGVALALLNVATLVITGHPWTITWAFTLWGAKLAMLAGWNPSTAPFWQGEFQQQALGNSILLDETSLMDIGIILGALLAALFSRRLEYTWRIGIGGVTASALGGLAMGYGARIAFGCNIGAFFSGVASTSLHGWIWIIAALAGTWIGVRLRPWFGLVN